MVHTQMYFKHPKILVTVIVTGFVVLTGFAGGSSYVFATDSNFCSGTTPAVGISPEACADNGDPTAVPPAALPGCGTVAKGVACTSDPDIISLYVNPIIDLLSSLVGVAVAISIITGGIQYTTSAGDPQKTAKAKGRIMNAIIALVAFGFLFAFLQFIIPGGAFNR